MVKATERGWSCVVRNSVGCPCVLYAWWVSCPVLPLFCRRWERRRFAFFRPKAAGGRADLRGGGSSLRTQTQILNAHCEEPVTILHERYAGTFGSGCM